VKIACFVHMSLNGTNDLFTLRVWLSFIAPSPFACCMFVLYVLYDVMSSKVAPYSDCPAALTAHMRPLTIVRA
jgi:hypothetical protein